MHLGQPALRKAQRIVRAGLIVLALIFIIAFRWEIWGVLQIFGTVFAVLLLGFPFNGFDPSIRDSFNIILFNCFSGFGLVFLLWLFLISGQALLPVNNLLEVYRTAWHLWLFITRQHGPAVFVKDGKIITTQDDAKRRGHGVIVVDFNSAVVLEERDVPPGFSRMMNDLDTIFLRAIGLVDSPRPTRVCGPGIVFMRPNERIHGVVDLRKQFRILFKVRCYTREGIELYSNVNAIFTVGQDPEPDALQVTYDGEARPDNLRVCVFKPVPGRKGKYLKLVDLSDELDEEDAKEIHKFASSPGFYHMLRSYEPLKPPSPLPVFNPERVFAAVFAQARDDKQETVPWTDLPTRLAADFYREILPQINYDELYGIKDSGSFPMGQYKRRLMLRMRNNGVLAYRMVTHCSGRPLEKDHEYHQSELLVTSPRSLTNSKLLRDRGIKVIASGFGDLFPVSELIYKQRLDSWRAEWERELDVTRAGRDLQAMRTRSKALAEAQENLWFSLNQLFSVQDHTDEALALLVLQALEAAAADPKTSALLPGHTIEVMRYLHHMLQDGSSATASAAPFQGLLGGNRQ